MATQSDTEYTINFFKPQRDHSRANMKMIIIMVIVWAVAVFGFQFLLYFLNEPVPEQTYTDFERVWSSMTEPVPSLTAQQDFTKIVLTVLGKNVVFNSPANRPDRVVLQETLSSMILQLAEPSIKAGFQNLFQEILVLEKEIKAATENKPNDKDGLKALETKLSAKQAALKQYAIENLSSIKMALGLTNEGFDRLRSALLPASLRPTIKIGLSPEMQKKLPAIMEKYCIHNMNALTQPNTFLGFPFHYWYTAQFLLILFVVLCLIYVLATDRIQKRYGFVEEQAEAESSAS